MSRATELSLATRIGAADLDWIVPGWPAPPGVNALVTTRAGGVSSGPYATLNLGQRTHDDPAALAVNHRRLNAFLPTAPTWLDQVHGAAVAVLGSPPNAMRPVADAAVTRETGVVCAVLTADCLPVLFADRHGNVVGIAHAGWRGLAGGVLEMAVAALGNLGASANDLLAWLGPAIGPAAFEVGADVHAAFHARDPGALAYFAPQREGKWLADLYGLARRQLAVAGVNTVSGGGYCTWTDAARFFSYRRERESGRMAALVWIAPHV
jgi:YfiH family protein